MDALLSMDASMDADMDPGSLGLQPIDRIRLWLGLTPDQFTDLERKGKASPPKGDRFGLRLEAIPALLRANLFQGGDYHPEEIIAVVVEFTSTLSPIHPSCEPFHQCDSQQTVICADWSVSSSLQVCHSRKHACHSRRGACHADEERDADFKPPHPYHLLDEWM